MWELGLNSPSSWGRFLVLEGVFASVEAKWAIEVAYVEVSRCICLSQPLYLQPKVRLGAYGRASHPVLSGETIRLIWSRHAGELHKILEATVVDEVETRVCW
jgi:hypothetical protein